MAFFRPRRLLVKAMDFRNARDRLVHHIIVIMALSPARNVLFLAAVTLAYGVAYGLLEASEFGFESRLDPFYFAWTVMSTVGFGDLHPKSDRAKLLVMTHQALLIGDALAILAALVPESKPKRRAKAKRA